MATEIALIELPEEKALEVFIAPRGLDPYLDQIADEARSLVPDVTTKKGRDAIASNAHKVAKSKTALDGVRKKLADWLKEKPKLVDAEGKRMRDFLDLLKDEVRKPLTDWEKNEEFRVQKHQLNIEGFGVHATEMDHLSAADLQRHIEFVEGVVVDASYEEFEAEAARAKDAALAKMRAARDAKIKYEAEQAELAKLRAAAAEREEQDRIAAEKKAQADREQQIAENARIEAEQKAAKEKADAEAKSAADIAAAKQRETDAQLAAERAENARAEAVRREEQAKADSEARAVQAAKDTAERIAREQAAEAKRIADEQAARDRDTKHKKAINNAAVDAMIEGGIDEATAKKVVTLIAKKQVPNVAISY